MRRAGQGRSQSGRFGEVDPEAVPPALVFAGHFRRGMTELLLHIAFFNLGGRGEASAQRVTRELSGTIRLAEIAAHAGGQGRFLDEARDLLVMQPIRPDVLALAAHPPEQRALFDPGEADPGLQRHDRAGGIGGSAADFDLAPAGLSAQRQQQALVQDLDPAAAVFGLVAAKVEAGEFRAAQSAGKADQQHGAVPETAQTVAIERFQHGDQVFRREGLLLAGRGSVLVADAGEHGGDRAILAVESCAAALRVVPGQRRQPPLDGGDRTGFAAAVHGAGGAGRDVQPDHVRIRGQGRKILAPAPGGKMLPVGGVGAARVGGGRGFDIAARALGEFLQVARQSGGSFGERGGEPG